MFKKYKFKSIQSNILLGILTVVILVLVITIVLAFKFTTEVVEENAKDYTFKLINQVERNIDYYLKEMDNISNAINYNFDVSEYLSDKSHLTASQKQNLYEKIQLEIEGMLGNRKDISSISIFGYNGNNIFSTNKEFKSYIDLESLDWYKSALNNDAESVFSGSHIQNIFEDEYLWVVTLSKEILDLKVRNGIGVLSIDLNYKIINEICNEIKLGDNGYIYIIDRDGELVYHPKQRLIHSNLEEEYIDEAMALTSGSFNKGKGADEKVYSVKLSSKTGWRIVGVSYVNEFVEDTNRLWTYYSILSVVALVIAVIVSNLVAKNISKPIKQLKESMEEVRDHNLNLEIVIDSENEIADLSHTFNEMTTEIKSLIQEKTLEQRKKRKSELKALQAQINPHFLYNTLDSIIWMSVEKRNEEVVEMTSALAKMYRLSISKGEEVISVRDEMNHIKNYLVIQKFRYGSKMDFTMDFDEDILDLKTLKIILQPIVENSIYHGIKNKMGSGNISIKGFRQDDYLILQVIDNGVGMKPETLNNIFNIASKNGNGVGVNNVDERIKLYFGKDYGLYYESELDVGTTVTIKLPIRKRGDDVEQI